MRDVFEKEYKDDSGDESDDEPGTKAPFKAKSAILQRCAQTWKSPKFILMAHGEYQYILNDGLLDFFCFLLSHAHTFGALTSPLSSETKFWQWPMS